MSGACVVASFAGESANNTLSGESEAAYKSGRVADPPITPRGEAQARALAAHLAPLPPPPPGDDDEEPAAGGPPSVGGASAPHPLVSGRIAHLYVSPMRRTLMTIAPLARATGLRPRVIADAYEVVTRSAAACVPHCCSHAHGRAVGFRRVAVCVRRRGVQRGTRGDSGS